MTPELLQALEQYASFAVLAIVTLVAVVIRARSRDPMLRGDLRGAITFLVLAILARAGHRLAAQISTTAVAETLLHVATLMLAAFGGIRLVIGLVLHLARRNGSTTPKILRDVLDGALYTVAAATILKVTFDLDLTALVTTSALLSVVLGLALQDTLGNLFSGLSLQLEHPFSPGDWVRLDGQIGRVTELSWRAVKIETLELELITIPNNVVAKGVIENLSRRLGGPVVRDLLIGIDYSAPPNLVREELLGALLQCAKVLPQPPPTVRVTGFQESAVEYRLRYWVPCYEDGASTDDEIYSALWYRLKRTGLEIPFPVRTVLLKRGQPSEGGSRADRDGNVITAQRRRTTLGTIDFLAPLRAEGLDLLATLVRREIYGAGEVIVRQGEPGELFYVLVEGEVTVQLAGVEAPLARLAPGAFFGEMSLLTGEPRAATVRAATDVALLTLDRSSFARVLGGAPAIAEQLAEALAQRQAGLEHAATGTGGPGPGDVRAETGKIFAKLRDIFQLRGGGGAGS